MTDTGEFRCESGKLLSTCQVVVKKGEDKPVINFPDRVEGPVSKPIVFEVPYTGKFAIDIQYSVSYCILNIVAVVTDIV